jgi:hypothetical protein
MTRDERDMLLVDIVVCRRLRNELDNCAWMLRDHLQRVIDRKEKQLREASDGSKRHDYDK